MLPGCTPWPDDFAREYRARGYWRDITLTEMLAETVARSPDRVAVVCGERRVTYRQLQDRADRLAWHFLRLGLRPRDRVVFQLANRVELLYALFGLVRIGVIPVMTLPPHRKMEIGHFAAHAAATAYLIPDQIRGFDYRRLAEQVRAETPSLRHVLVCGEPLPGQVSLIELLDREAPADAAAVLAAHRPPPDEVALMLLSGGTTGLPKMIPRTHNDYVYNTTTCSALLGFGPDTVFLAVLPLAHNYNLACPGVLGTIAQGGRTVIAPDVAAETVFPLIERERVTVVSAAVPLVVKWLAADRDHDLSSLQVFTNGGARLAPELRRRIEQRFRCTFVESFGTGEGLINQTRLDDSDALRLNSSGRPISPADEIKIVDESDNELPDGAVGELVVRGPYTIRGYYDAPEINARAFTPDGFYRMGDAVKKVDGYLYVEGRKKDLINRGGEKISCEEVENFILAHPDVESACVVAMPDEVYGEKACAFIVPRNGRLVTFPQLIEFLMTREIAKFKLPERLELVDEMPLSPAGKILRRELRALIAGKLEQEQHQRDAGVPA